MKSGHLPQTGNMQYGRNGYAISAAAHGFDAIKRGAERAAKSGTAHQTVADYANGSVGAEDLRQTGFEKMRDALRQLIRL